MTPESTQDWYAQLEKPFFAPPAWLFGPAWTVLYVLIAISFGYVFVQIARKRWPLSAGLPFAVNLLANLLFSPLQFGLRSNVLALLDILLVLVTIPWMMRTAWPRARWVAYAQLPYLLWVAFATILQISVTWLNGW